jgi:hypothetical protein
MHTNVANESIGLKTLSISHRTPLRVRCATAAVLFAGICISGPAAAQAPYTFTGIADTTGLGVYCAGTNNEGVVIFNFSTSTPGSLGTELWRGDGQVLTRVAQTVTTICGSINDSGEISYGTADLATSNVGRLIKNSHGVLTTLASGDTSPSFAQSTYLPAISANGSVLFQSWCSFGAPWGINVAPSAPTPYDCADAAFEYTSALSMNDSQVVVFTGRAVADGKIGIYRGPGLVPLVADTQVLSGLPVINNSNTVAFVGFVNGQYGLYRTSDGVALTRVDQPVAPVQTAPGFSINDSGDVAFEGADQSGAGGIVFIGPGADLRTVIATGMLLDGSTVTSARIWPESLNNKGQLALLVRFADGREGIYRAEPPDTLPPVVTAPSPITVSATEANGARGAASAALAAFLTAGTAVDNSDSNPLRLSPQVNGVDVDNSTLFAIGTTTVAFRFQDTSANIGTATSTVQVTGSTCATDITNGVTFSDGRTQLNKRTGFYTVQVRMTIANGGRSTITGPISLVLDNLPSGVLLRNQQGTTACAGPLGSPYVNVDIGADGVWSRKERISVDLEFTSPTASISFNRRVLAGGGGR